MNEPCVNCGEESDEMALCDRPHCGPCYDIHVQFADDECHCDGSGIVYGLSSELFFIYGGDR